MIKTGIFSGSFNPVHIGHLALANYLCEFEGLDEVWFMVTPHNPLKNQSDLWPDQFRLKLVESAIAGYDKFKAYDFEFTLPRPSYTVNTLEKLSLQYPDRQFHLIIGSDNWQLFNRWYKADEIIARYHLLVYPRPGYPIDDEAGFPASVRMTNAPVFDISSTFIRESLAQDKDIRYFLHPEVYKIIADNRSELF